MKAGHEPNGQSDYRKDTIEDEVADLIMSLKN